MGDEGHKEDELHRVIQHMCRGDGAALDFCMCLIHMVAVYDDLIDKDDVSEADIHLAFEIGTIRLPANPFYRTHFNALAPYILGAINNWKVANKLEAENATSEDLRIAFVLRSSYVEVFSVVAMLLHGHKAAIDWAVQLRRAAADETYVAYKREKDEAAASNVVQFKTGA